MSMYEIEGLVESSINAIGKTQNTSLDKKTIIWNLYDKVQNNFDCSFTNFRVMNILLETGYTQTIAVQEHPDYKTNQAFFDGLKEKGFTSILKNPSKPWSRENPSTSYYSQKQDLIYFDYGSPLWKQIQQGEAPNPTNLNVFETGLLVMKEAEKLKDLTLISEWYGFISNFYSFFGDAKNFEDLREQYLNEMKTIYLRSEACKIISDSHENLRVPDEEKLKAISAYFDDDLLEVMRWFVL